MKRYIDSNIGRLRILGFLEGSSLLTLLFLAVPVKYMLGNPILVKWVGQIHGILFILFVINALKVGVEERWVFSKVTWKVILASFFPFGTFYIDRKILSIIHNTRP